MAEIESQVETFAGDYTSPRYSLEQLTTRSLLGRFQKLREEFAQLQQMQAELNGEEDAPPDEQTNEG